MRKRKVLFGLFMSGLGSIVSHSNAGEVGPQSGGSITLQDGDTVTLTNGGTGIDSTMTGGDGLRINGSAVVSVTGGIVPIGVALDNSANNDLGSGSRINVTDSGMPFGLTAHGIFVSGTNPDTNIAADRLQIQVKSAKDAYGILDQGTGGVTDLGQGSSISATSTSGTAHGLYLANRSGDFQMNGGTIRAMSDTGDAHGIKSPGNARIDLGNGSRIEVNAGGNAAGLTIGDGGEVRASGLDIVVSGNSLTYGVALGSGSTVDLGTGSSIRMNGRPGYADGVSLGGTNSSFTADGLILDMSITNTGSNLSGRGVRVYGAGSRVDLGSGSTITMRGFILGGGITLTGWPSGKKPVSFVADHLAVDVTGNWMYGIQMDGGTMDLGSGSRISATGVAETIWVTGGKFKADALTVNTVQSTGIDAQGGVDTVKVTVGAGSVVDGRGAGASGSTNGISASYAGFGSGTTTLDFHGTAQNRNAIYAMNGYGVSAQFQGQTVNISNTDIYMSGDGMSYGLWATGSNSLSRPGIINGENLTIDVTGNGVKGYGVVVQQGGAVDLKGNTVIRTNGGIAIWNPSMTSSGTFLPSGTITGSGRMTIVGDIVSGGWGTIDLNMNAGSVFEGAAHVNTDPAARSVLNLALASESLWVVTDSSEVSKLANHGNIIFSNDDSAGAFNTLTVHEYPGGGNITFNADVSAANHGGNRLILDGPLATPLRATLVSINGRGHDTARTNYSAVMLVDARNGAVTQAGDFALNPRAGNYNRDGTDTVAIGAYNYGLVSGHGAVDPNDWYLSYTSTTPPAPAPDPTPAPSPAPIINMRPEAGAYLGNQMIAQSMFNMTLHDRRSYSGIYGTGVGGLKNGGDERRLWGRLDASRANGYSAADGRIGFDTDSVVLQFGSDIAQHNAVGGQFILGVMGGYGHARTDSDALTNGRRIDSDGRVDGYSAGIYGSWYADAQARQGAYVDSWLQYSWFDNKVSGSLARDDHYDSDNWAASVEAGYAWQPAGNLMLEPQAQLIFNRYSADEHRDGGGTLIRSADSGDFSTRLGVRLSGTSRVQPYAEFNWWHGDSDNSIWMNRDEVVMDGLDDAYEVRIGVQGELMRNLHVWAEASGQQGDGDFSAYGGTFGLNYRW